MKSACPLPCTVSGLILQGATFHTGAMKESSPDANEMCPAPNVCIGFTTRDADEMYPEEKSVSLPVYLTPTREEFLLGLQMPIDDGDQERWIQAGVALFLNEDE